MSRKLRNHRMMERIQPRIVKMMPIRVKRISMI
jgi:hypothetical protein